MNNPAPRILECKEHEVVSLPIQALFPAGKFSLDSRIADRGYLDVSISGGQVVLRTTKFVGLIPLTAEFSLRVIPKIPDAVLGELLIRSGVVPRAIVDFDRGYLPRFSIPAEASTVFLASFRRSLEVVVRRGLIKRYLTLPDPPPWRGRLSVAATVSRFRSKGVKYRSVFQYVTLTPSMPENAGLLEALLSCSELRPDKKETEREVSKIRALLPAFAHVPRWRGASRDLVAELAKRAASLPVAHDYYRPALWYAYSVLQDRLPDPDQIGLARLDSLIVNVSEIFEAFVRNALVRTEPGTGWIVRNGNTHPLPQFKNSERYKVQPDILLEKTDCAPVVVEVKYKTQPKEIDRYEIMAFMEASGSKLGVFVCPEVEGAAAVEFIGETTGGMRLYTLRVNIGGLPLDIAERTFCADLQKIIASA